MSDKKKGSSPSEGFRTPEVVEEVKVKPRKSSFLSLAHPELPRRKKSVDFRPKEIIIIQEQIRQEQEEASNATGTGPAAGTGDDLDAEDKEVAQLDDLKVEEDDDEDEDEDVADFSRFKLRPPTPPGVSHKKAEIKVGEGKGKDNK